MIHMRIMSWHGEVVAEATAFCVDFFAGAVHTCDEQGRETGVFPYDPNKHYILTEAVRGKEDKSE